MCGVKQNGGQVIPSDLDVQWTTTSNIYIVYPLLYGKPTLLPIVKVSRGNQPPVMAPNLVLLR